MFAIIKSGKIISNANDRPEDQGKQLIRGRVHSLHSKLVGVAAEQDRIRRTGGGFVYLVRGVTGASVGDTVDAYRITPVQQDEVFWHQSRARKSQWHELAALVSQYDT